MGCPWLAITRASNRPKEEFWAQLRIKIVHLPRRHDGSRQREDPKVDSENDLRVLRVRHGQASRPRICFKIMKMVFLDIS